MDQVGQDHGRASVTFRLKVMVACLFEMQAMIQKEVKGPMPKLLDKI